MSREVLIIGAIGGTAALIMLLVLTALAVAFFLLTSHVIDRVDDRRTRRRDLATCRAIDRLGTTDNPEGTQ
ncbi:hypothetical protein [Streptomyces scopuliridis]|uniref:hypothetical protein n=1 Tax=Streptomyces scopuliridis TaxID=452529 RepID=UPI00342D96F7